MDGIKYRQIKGGKIHIAKKGSGLYLCGVSIGSDDRFPVSKFDDSQICKNCLKIRGKQVFHDYLKSVRTVQDSG